MNTLAKFTLTLLVAATAANANINTKNGLITIVDPEIKNFTYEYDAKNKTCTPSADRFTQIENIPNWNKANGCNTYSHKVLNSGYIVECKKVRTDTGIKNKTYVFGATEKDCLKSGKVAAFHTKHYFNSKTGE